MKREAKTRVYFVKPVALDGPIKIGCSDNPTGRLLSLMVWSPWPLEIIGSVPGSFADESFIHSCFADLHSHREWFRSSPHLRSAIETVLSAGSVAAVRDTLKPVGSIKNKSVISDESRRYRSYGGRVRCAIKRLRYETLDEVIYFVESDKVNSILSSWYGRLDDFGRRVFRTPHADDIAHLESFISDPVGNGAVRRTITRLRREGTAA